ncbi:MAG: hypothetical protein H6839_08965 [Planctomycetes bacterium]|nr:hypothetical protein [Planctomycetota bacterium]
MRTVRDKLLLVALAVLIVAPFAVYFAVSGDSKDVCESAEDLRKMADDEPLVVTRALKDDDLAELDRFTNLQDLQLHYSDITDAGVPHIARHSEMKRLVLHATKLTDTGARRLAGLTGLEELVLIGCIGVTSDGLKFLPDMPKLKQLVLHQLPEVDDGIGETVAQCHALESLEFEVMRGITNKTVFAIASLTQLRVLVLDLCPNVTDEAIVAVAAMEGLETLSLEGADEMTDASLPGLQRLKKLKKLNLPVRAKLSKAAIDNLKAALPDCQFNR